MVRVVVAVLLVALAGVSSLAHAPDYEGHRCELCEYLDPSRPGPVECGSPLADPRTGGHTCHDEDAGCHNHSGQVGGSGTEDVDFCPVPDVVIPPPVVCHDGLTTHCQDTAYGAHSTHDCEVCDGQNGTCGWEKNHRHPAMCPNKEIDPPVDPPDDDDDPPPLEVCQVTGWHSHADAFEGRCHDEEFMHGYVGCNWNGGPGGHKHDGLACHLATDSHEDPPPVVDKPRSEGGSGAGGGGTREVVVPPARTVVPPVVTPAAKLEARRKAAIENMRNGSWLHALD